MATGPNRKPPRPLPPRLRINAGILRRIMRERGITIKQLERICLTDKVMVRRWISGETRVPKYVLAIFLLADEPDEQKGMPDIATQMLREIGIKH